MSDQVRNPEDRFSHNEAHLSTAKQFCHFDLRIRLLFFHKNQSYCRFYEPCCEKTGLRGFRPGPTQPVCTATEDGLKLEISDLESSIRVGKTKALISYAVTAKLICVFVFAYAKSRFSHNEAHIQ